MIYSSHRIVLPLPKNPEVNSHCTFLPWGHIDMEPGCKCKAGALFTLQSLSLCAIIHAQRRTWAEVFRFSKRGLSYRTFIHSESIWGMVCAR